MQCTKIQATILSHCAKNQQEDRHRLHPTYAVNIRQLKSKPTCTMRRAFFRSAFLHAVTALPCASDQAGLSLNDSETQEYGSKQQIKK